MRRSILDGPHRRVGATMSFAARAEFPLPPGSDPGYHSGRAWVDVLWRH